MTTYAEGLGIIIKELQDQAGIRSVTVTKVNEVCTKFTTETNYGNVTSTIISNTVIEESPASATADFLLKTLTGNIKQLYKRG